MQKVHFISIGGSAMHNLALALQAKGYQITGSDDEIVEPSRSRLAAYDLLPESYGWFPEKITKSLDAVIIGMHARGDNPEIARAKELGISLYSYPEYIYEQSKDKLRVVIGGSHGKTSTTAMIMHVLRMAGKDFDYLVGASLSGFDLNVKLSESAPLMIIEGDEYLSSPIDLRPKFHLYKANIAVLTGIAWDHINVFPTFENYLEQFKIFLQTMETGGTVIYYEGDEKLSAIVNAHESTSLLKEPYGMPDHKIENGTSILLVNNKLAASLPENASYEVPLQIFGDHNLLNLNAAFHVVKHLGVSEVEFYHAAQSFMGASRRLEKVAESENLVVFWDFAHSPSKLKATTEAVKEQFPGKKLIACMELHTFSSLNPAFLQEYQSSMDLADVALVYYNRHTLEHKKLPPLSEDAVRWAFGRQSLEVITDSGLLQEHIKGMDLHNCILLLMSSGNFDGINIKEFASSLL